MPLNKDRKDNSTVYLKDGSAISVFLEIDQICIENDFLGFVSKDFGTSIYVNKEEIKYIERNKDKKEAEREMTKEEKNALKNLSLITEIKEDDKLYISEKPIKVPKAHVVGYD